MKPIHSSDLAKNKIDLADNNWWQPDEVCSKLKELRELLNLKLREVEEATGVSNAYLSQLETGKIGNPSYKVVYVLREFYLKTLKSKF